MNHILSEITNLQASPILETDVRVFKNPQWASTLASLNYAVLHVDESPTNKYELLQALKQACGFPDYFGHNWDALADVLRDFHWFKADGYLIVFNEPAELNDSEWNIFLDIVREASAFWEGEGKVFKIVVPK